jgi:hypothetical protein
MLVATREVAACGHAERSRERGASVARSIAVMLAFSAEKEAVESIVLADGMDAVPASGEHLVDIALVRDVENESILRSVENTVEGKREFDDSEIRPQMAAGLAERFDESLADFFREGGQSLQRQGFEIGGGGNGWQFGVHRV